MVNLLVRFQDVIVDREIRRRRLYLKVQILMRRWMKDWDGRRVLVCLLGGVRHQKDAILVDTLSLEQLIQLMVLHAVLRELDFFE